MPCLRPPSACSTAAHLRLQRVGKVEAAGRYPDLDRARVLQGRLCVACIELQGLPLAWASQGIAQLPDDHSPHATTGLASLMLLLACASVKPLFLKLSLACAYVKALMLEWSITGVQITLAYAGQEGPSEARYQCLVSEV